MKSAFSMFLLGCMAALCLTTTPRSANAAEEVIDSRSLLEEPKARQGYWVGFGMSPLAAQLNEKGKDKGIYGGSAFTLRLGQNITRRLGLGLLVEYGGVGKSSDKGGIGGITLEGTCQLWRNLSAHTGFGVGYIYVTDKEALDDSMRGGGGSYFMLGASYDFFPWRNRLTGGWAITPTVDFHAMPDGNIKYLAVYAGLQVVWWSGLPKNMLVLPED
jgi:hypothetical protein